MTVKQILKIIVDINEFHIESEDEFRLYSIDFIDSVVVDFGNREVVAISFYEDCYNDKICNIKIK